jgi:serine protease Do
MGKAFSSIAEKASPAVVSLSVERPSSRDSQRYYQSPFGSPFEDDFFDFFRRRSPRQRSPQRREIETAKGTGFIISPDGYILTNNHMVGGAKKVEIELSDGREFKAEIIGTDEPTDIAVVKIDAKNLPHLELADSDEIEVGEWVLAIGNPLGLTHTVTAGIVSAKGRGELGLAKFENFIQTDAAINFGNSGGPLLNLDGKVVGMNTAIVGATGSIGLGFAIPINMAKHVYEQLLEDGKIERGFLGIGLEELNPALAASLGLERNTKGVAIPSVVEDSAADKAGLKPYDVIVELNGEPVEKENDLLNRVAILKPGTTVEVVVLRDGKRKTFNVKLGKRPSEEELAGGLPADTQEELGFTVETLTDDVAERFGYEGETGVIVSTVVPGSEAAELLITPYSLIKEVNRQKVRNKEEFYAEIKKAKKKGGALLLVKRGRTTFLALLTLSK